MSDGKSATSSLYHHSSEYFCLENEASNILSINIAIPVAMQGHELSLTLTPKKSNRNEVGHLAAAAASPAVVSSTQVQPSSPALVSSTQVQPSLPSASLSTNTPPNTPLDPPIYTANPPGDISTQLSNPNDANTSDIFGPVVAIGRKEMRNYVVIRGRKIGVFYAFWCVTTNHRISDHLTSSRADIESYVKNPITKARYRGALWQRVESYQHGEELFRAAEVRGDTRIIS